MVRPGEKARSLVVIANSLLGEGTGTAKFLGADILAVETRADTFVDFLSKW